MKRAIMGAVVLTLFLTGMAWALVPTAELGNEFLYFTRDPNILPSFGVGTRLGVYENDFGFLLSFGDVNVPYSYMGFTEIVNARMLGIDFVRRLSRAVKFSLGYGKIDATLLSFSYYIGAFPYIDMKGDFELVSGRNVGGSISLNAGLGYRWVLNSSAYGMTVLSDHMISRLFVNLGL